MTDYNLLVVVAGPAEAVIVGRVEDDTRDHIVLSSACWMDPFLDIPTILQMGADAPAYYKLLADVPLRLNRSYVVYDTQWQYVLPAAPPQMKMSNK